MGEIQFIPHPASHPPMPSTMSTPAAAPARAAPPTSYASSIKALHWLTAAIWIVSWIVAFIGVHWRDVTNHDHQLTFLHKALASTIIFLTLIRIAARLASRAPLLPATMSPRMQTIAHMGHLAIYAAALVALPLSGWYWSSVANKPIMLLGLFQLPPIAAPDKSLYDLAKALHTYSAWACGGLIAGHVAAAVKHQFIDRDGLMDRMSFRRPSRR